MAKTSKRQSKSRGKTMRRKRGGKKGVKFRNHGDCGCYYYINHHDVKHR